MGETQENWVTCYHLQSVQLSCSVVSDSLRPHGLQHTRLPCPSPIPGACNHLILCCLLLLPSIFPSIRVFSNQSVVHIRWPKYCSCSFSISPSNEYSGLISLKVDWFDLHAFQRTRKSLLQHHSSKASIFLHLAFFMVQLESVIVPFLSFSFYSFPVVTSASPAPQWKQGRKYGLPLPTGSNKATSPFGHSIRRGQLKRQFK